RRALDEAGRDTVAPPVRPDARCDGWPAELCLDTQAGAEHRQLALVPEGMVRQCERVTLGPAAPWGGVGHAAGGLHVAVLAVPAHTANGAGLPFAVGGVHPDGGDGALVAGGAVAGVAGEGGGGGVAPGACILGARGEVAPRL